MANIAAAGKFNAVKVNYMFDANHSNWSARSGLLIDSDHEKSKWEVAIFDIEEFLATFTDGDFDYTADLAGYYNQGGSYSLYVGDITFETWDFDKNVLDKGDPRFIPSANYETMLHDNNSITSVFVSKEDIAGLEGVTNTAGYTEIGYKGDALKLSLSAADAGAYLEMPYTKSEYEILRQTEGSSVYGASHVCINSLRVVNSGSYTENISGALLHNRIGASGAWCTKYIPWDDFMAAFNAADSDSDNTTTTSADDRLFIAQHYADIVGGYDIYVGNIDFGVWPNSVADKGYLGFAVDSNSVDKTSYTGSSTESYVPYSDLPVKEGYSGDAVLISGLTSARSFYVTMPYTAAEYDALAEAGVISKIKFTYMVIKGTNTKFTIQTSSSYYSLISKFGDSALTTRVWNTCEIDLTKVKLAEEGVDTGNGKFRLVTISNSTKTDVYFGGVTVE